MKSPSDPLRRRAESLPDLDDHLAGHSPREGVEIPSSILCFCRRDASLLLRYSNAFHRDHHHRCVLLCALAGSGEVCVDRGVERLEPGSCILIAPYQFHHYRAFATRRIAWLYVTFEIRTDFLTGPLQDAGPLRLGNDENALLDQLLRAWEEDREGASLPLLLGSLLCGLRARARRRKEAPPAGDADFLTRINALVLEKKRFPLKELASVLGSSESHLWARFRKATGLSLGRHIRQLRIQKACGLLASSAMRVDDVAETCRFSSVYAFSRSFRSAVGVSPSQYRRRQRDYARPLAADKEAGKTGRRQGAA